MDSFEKTLESPLDAELVPPPPPRIRIVRDGILAFVVANALILILVVPVIVVGAFAGSVNLNATTFAPTPNIMIALLVVSQIPLVGVGLFLRWRYKRSARLLPDLFEGSSGRSILIGVGAGLAMAAFGTVHALVATALFGKATTAAMEELVKSLQAAMADPSVLSGMVFCIAILVPLCEEFFFRGAIFSSVRSGQSARAAAIVSSVLFAVAHGNWMMFTYYLVLGFTMCWLASRTRTLVAPMAAHITVNATATIAMVLGSSTN